MSHSAPSHSHSHTHSHAHDAHSHSHSHAHGGHDFAGANEAFFDDLARRYEEMPLARELTKRQADGILGAFPQLFSKERTDMMDYACGIGMISALLFPSVKSILGVDISQGSVDEFNRRCALMGVTEAARAVRAELKGVDGELDDRKFDVIICVSAYHHIESPRETTRVLAHFLKPGGTLLVCDGKAEEDGSSLFPGGMDHVVAHQHGMSEADMRAAFVDTAGLVDYKFQDLFTVDQVPGPNGPIDRKFTGFLASGVKPQP